MKGIMLVATLWQCGLAIAVRDDPVVTIADGQLLGSVQTSLGGNEYWSFQGVPFAAPPVGNLRFRAPQPVTPWEGELDVSGTSQYTCIQYGYMTDGNPETIKGSEDCLYLNVWVPANRDPDKSLAVMMWIYGGSLTAGSNRFMEYGPKMFMDHDVIIVSPNYRLGPFGFTYLGIEEAPGNQGFLDLIAALQWIQTNIGAFGGDPERVTIFGESAGSWAVSYLTLTPLASGLFHRGIMQSGGVFNPYWLWYTDEDAMMLTNYMTEELKCTTSANEDVYGALECLLETPVDVLESTTKWSSEDTLNTQIILRPTGVVDGNFLPDNPVKLMETGAYNHVDLMVGVTKDEGLLQLLYMEADPKLYMAFVFYYESLCPVLLFGRFANMFITDEERDMCAKFTEYYLESKANFNHEHIQNVTNMISDTYIWYGAYKQAEWAAVQGDNVYKYIFSFKGTYGYADAFPNLDNSQYGVCHSDELFYFWSPYWSRLETPMNADEELVSAQVLEAWTSFAKTGQPTISGIDAVWEPATADNGHYLNIDREIKMELSDEYVDRMALWDEIYSFPEGNYLNPQDKDAKIPSPVDLNLLNGFRLQ